MICPNCKANMEEGSTICKACGTKIEVEGYHFKASEDSPQPVYYADDDSGRTVNKVVGGVFGALAAILICMAIAFLIMPNIKETIDLSDYIEVTCTGYDGMGTVSVSLDTEALEKAIRSKAKFDGDGDSDEALDQAFAYAEQIYSAYSSVKVSIDCKNNGSLENGDTYKVMFDYDNKEAKELGIKFKGETTELTVRGLELTKTVDVFRNLHVMFDGTSPNITATVVTGRYNEYEFTLSQTENLKEGDVITLTIPEETVESMLMDKGIIPEETERSYTVELSE